jgi:hypothetical protein
MVTLTVHLGADAIGDKSLWDQLVLARLYMLICVPQHLKETQGEKGCRTRGRMTTRR